MALIETAQWRIKKKDHDRFASLIVHGPEGDDSMGLIYQSKHPELVKYARTNTYFREIPDSDEEVWFFVDEYQDREHLEMSHKNYVSDGEKVHYAKMIKLEKEMMIPGSMQGPFVWTVQSGSNFDFPDRLK